MQAVCGLVGQIALGAARCGSIWFGSRSPEETPVSRMSLFNSPLLLGFDHFERALDRVQKAQAHGYPPYNLEQI